MGKFFVEIGGCIVIITICVVLVVGGPIGWILLVFFVTHNQSKY
jgi:hypothetical protein